MSQFTYTGLVQLTEGIAEGELVVLFRNDHFATVLKHKGQLYLLLTDQGFRDVGAVYVPARLAGSGPPAHPANAATPAWFLLNGRFQVAAHHGHQRRRHAG